MSYKLGEKDVVNNIDVVIVMDCTGSMQKWINAAKDTVLEAFHNIREKYPESFIRLGLVCYRDIGDYEPFIISPITESIETIQDVLKGVRATGGNDEAEDIAGAFEKTIELFKNCGSINSIKIVLLVTDAPAHGLRYHPITVGDRFPNGDPNEKEPYDQVREMAFMGIDLTIFRIKDIVNTMIEEFQKAFVGTNSVLTVLDLKKQDDGNDGNKEGVSAFSSSLSSLSLINGFIDLSSYDEYDKYDESRYSECSEYKKDPLPILPKSEEKIFKESTCKSIIDSIQRRKGI